MPGEEYVWYLVQKCRTNVMHLSEHYMTTIFIKNAFDQKKLFN